MKRTSDQTILITGATDGLGKQLALNLAGEGATVLLHGRTPARGEAVTSEIKEETGNDRIRYYNADFSSLSAVDKLAGEILSNQSRLDVLINNAGIGPGPMPGAKREESQDGIELRFAVNYLAPFSLTHRLIPLLTQSAPARVVNVASIGQQALDFDDLMMKQHYDGMDAYCRSKLAMIMFTFDAAERLGETGVTVNALHPATLMDTKMVHEAFPNVMSSVKEGMEAVKRLAVSPEVEGVTGKFFDGLRESRPKAQAFDEEARIRLRAESQRLTGPIDTA
jgi:NAD(P)-dependent dehydrogenase (short-subunit alcohol dehydrogenase family)